MKCDERRPSCGNCATKGRKCAGYKPSISTSDSNAIRYDLPSQPLESGQESRAFQYFQHRTCGQLAGSYQTEEWSQIVLQLAHVDPSIRHAAVALASIHEDFERRGKACTSLDTFGFQQYRRAVRKLASGLGHPQQSSESLSLYLTSCVLFTCIELIQFHYHSASSLVRRGVRLLRELLASAQQSAKQSLEVYERFFCRLKHSALLSSGLEGRMMTIHHVSNG